MTDVTALHGQVSQVRGVSKSTRGQLLDVIASEIELHSVLRTEQKHLLWTRKGSCAIIGTGMPSSGYPAPDLVDGRRNLGQVLPDAGHAELDLVTHTLLWTFCWMCSRDVEEEAEQQDPEGVGTELFLRVHLRTTAFDRHTGRLDSAI